MIDPTVFTGLAGQLGYFIHVHKHFRVNATSEHYILTMHVLNIISNFHLTHRINHLVKFILFLDWYFVGSAQIFCL